MFLTKQNITILPQLFQNSGNFWPNQRKVLGNKKKNVSCKWKGRQYLSNLKDVIHPKRETEGEIMGTGDEEEKKINLRYSIHVRPQQLQKRKSQNLIPYIYKTCNIYTKNFDFIPLFQKQPKTTGNI